MRLFLFDLSYIQKLDTKNSIYIELLPRIVMETDLIAPIIDRKMKVRCDYWGNHISWYGLTAQGGFVCWSCWDYATRYGEALE